MTRALVLIAVVLILARLVYVFGRDAGLHESAVACQRCSILGKGIK